MAVSDLITARDNAEKLLSQITANPQPNYSVDGESVSWSEYYARLEQSVENLSKQIARRSPYIVNTRATL